MPGLRPRVCKGFQLKVSIRHSYLTTNADVLQSHVQTHNPLRSKPHQCPHASCRRGFSAFTISSATVRVSTRMARSSTPSARSSRPRLRPRPRERRTRSRTERTRQSQLALPHRRAPKAFGLLGAPVRLAPSFVLSMRSAILRPLARQFKLSLCRLHYPSHTAVPHRRGMVPTPALTASLPLSSRRFAWHTVSSLYPSPKRSAVASAAQQRRGSSSRRWFARQSVSRSRSKAPDGHMPLVDSSFG